MNNIFLIGFMGAGKTTLAPLIANKLNLKWIDLDKAIEEACGLDIPLIWQQFGEAYFRNKETEVLQTVVKKEAFLIACGGGTILKEENIQMMKENGLIIYLQMEDQVFKNRLTRLKNRPLLIQKSLEEILDFKKKRDELYSTLTPFHFLIKEESVNQTLDRFMGYIQTVENFNLVEVLPSQLAGSIKGMDSKSYFHRALVMASISNRPSFIEYDFISEDVWVTIEALRAMGSEIEEVEEGLLKISPIPIDYYLKDVEINCKESGSTLRFLLPLAAVIGGEITFKGEGRLSNRPIEPLLKFLKNLGITFEGDILPFKMRGKVDVLEGKIEGSLSSQFCSGLLMASTRALEKGKIIIDGEITSSGYIEMTKSVIQTYEGYIFNQEEKDLYYKVPKDFSSAAFWMGANILGADIQVLDLEKDEFQKDSFILDLISVYEKPEELMIDIQDIPDLAPVLCVICGLRNGKTRILNIERLAYKESNRLLGCLEMIQSLGGKIILDGNSYVIEGVSSYKGGYIHSNNDHRMVMAAAIGSLKSEESIWISYPQSVSKSYPQFFEDFKLLGGEIREFKNW